MESIQLWDVSILDYIYDNMHTAFLDTIMPVISNLVNSGIIWILCIFVFAIIPKTRKLSFAIFIAIIIELVVVNFILKPAVGRIRPFELNTAVELLVKIPGDASFPSGHTGVSFAGATAMFLIDKRFGIPALIFACLVGFSRLYLYMHFPTDVIVGMIVGILSGIAAVKITKRLSEKNRLFVRLK